MKTFLTKRYCKTEEQFPLQICGERAARHVHYGATTCFSCRAFFRSPIFPVQFYLIWIILCESFSFNFLQAESAEQHCCKVHLQAQERVWHQLQDPKELSVLQVSRVEILCGHISMFLAGTWNACQLGWIPTTFLPRRKNTKDFTKRREKEALNPEMTSWRYHHKLGFVQVKCSNSEI